MMFPHVIVVEHGKSGAIESVGDGEGVNLLGETIDDGENSVVTIGGVKACDEVNRDVFPRGSGDRIGDEFTGRGKVRVLGCLASDARLNIGINLGVHVGPPVVAGDKLCSPPFAWVSSKGRVIVKCDDFGAELQVFGDIDLSITEKEAVFEFPFCTTNYLLSFGLEIFGQLGNFVIVVF